MAVDLDNPETWNEIDLAKAAETGSIETVEAEEEPKVTVKPDPVPETAAEPEAVKEVIKTKDGAHEIPYEVLKQTRESLTATKSQLDAVMAELEALKAQPVAAAPITPSNTIPPEVEARLAKVKENWGEDLEAQARQQYLLEQQVLRQQAMLEQLHSQVSNQTQRQQQDEQGTIEDAIAASPTLNSWALAEDQTWFERSTQIHATLMKTDPVYASADWFQRMKQLPGRVEALFGATPTAAPVIDTAAAKAKVQAAMDKPPTSLSELSGGSTPEQPELDKLSELSGNKLTAYMNKLASDPRKFEAYLRSIS